MAWKDERGFIEYEFNEYGFWSKTGKINTHDNQRNWSLPMCLESGRLPINVRGHCTKEKLEDLAKEYNVKLTCEVEFVEEGWANQSKGLLQVLWERG